MKKKFFFISFFIFLTFVKLSSAFAFATPKVQTGGDSVYATHSVVLKSDGKIWAWGRNEDGQLGIGSYTDSYTPVQVGTDSDWIDVATGINHTVAIKRDGSLWGWGDHSFGQLGLGDNAAQRYNTPQRIGNDTDWVAISAGGFFTLALKSNGTLWAFGDNAYGQLGDGTFWSKKSPVQVYAPGVTFVKISAGGHHVLAISSTNELYSWGSNDYGQVGNGNVSIDAGTPVKISTANNWIMVSAGSEHSMALNSSGELYVWGSNAYVQLGLGDQVNRSIPTKNTNLPLLNVSSIKTTIAAGWTFSAVLDDGNLYMWGYNSHGQFCHVNNPTGSSIPILVDSSSKWFSIWTTGYNTIGLQTDPAYTLWTCGRNNFGQIGDGTNVPLRASPTQIGYPDIYVEPSSKNFGIIDVNNSSIPVSYTLTNTGFKPLNITSIPKIGDIQDFSLAENCTTAEIPINDSCSIDIAFTPKIAGVKNLFANFISDAPFANNTYINATGTGQATITITINPSYTGVVTGYNISCPGDCEENLLQSQITLSATPITEYTFSGWSGDINDTQNPIQITMDSSNKSVIANFILNTYTVTPSAGNGGIIAPNAPQIVNHGSTASFTVTPNTGYHILSVTGCGGSLNGNVYTTEAITADCNVTATFAINQYNLTVNKTGTGSGTITATGCTFIWTGNTGTCTALHGTTVTITTIPDPDTMLSSVGCDTSSSNNCNVTLTSNKNIQLTLTRVITINNRAKNTSNRTVTLTIEKPGVTQMQLYYGYKWTKSEAYATTKTITLPSQDGLKEVYVRFNDGSQYKSSIYLDTKAPTGTITINGGASITTTQEVTLSITLNEITGNDVQMRFSNDKTNWSNWESYSPIKNWTLSDGYGIKTVYCQIKDSAGNSSPIILNRINYQQNNITYTPLTIQINDGSLYTNKTSVVLNITPPIGAAMMRLSQDNIKWTAWLSIKPQINYNLKNTNGIKTVLIQYQDANKNQIAGTYGASIILDTKKPTGSILINNGLPITNNTNVTLTIDSVDEYEVEEMQLSTNGTDWGSWELYTTSKTITLPEPDGAKKIFIRFKDKAGNISITYNDSIILDRRAPVGKIVINNNAATTTNEEVTLSITAIGSVWMQIDNGNGYGNWEPYQTKKTITLPGGTGDKIVKVKFKDLAGNISEEYSDSIILQ